MANKSESKRSDNEARDNRRQDRADELRERLQGVAYLTQIEKAVKQLTNIGNTLKRHQKTMQPHEVAVIKTRISAIKLAAEINFRRLAKLLPDLRAVEFTDPDGNNPLSGLVDAIMRNQKDNEK